MNISTHNDYVRVKKVSTAKDKATFVTDESHWQNMEGKVVLLSEEPHERTVNGEKVYLIEETKIMGVVDEAANPKK